jgi:hypothetical protein
MLRAFLLCLAAVVSLPAAALPVVQFEESSVTATGVTPGGAVVVFGVAKELRGFLVHQERIDAVLTAGADGVAVLARETPVPAQSVWAVVDLATGELALGAPEGSELREIPFPAAALAADLRALQGRYESLDVLVVRPGAAGSEGLGAWGLFVADGGERDGDGRQDRRLRASLSQLLPLGDSPAPPESLVEGDVVVAVDSETLQVFAARLAR